MSTFRQRAQLIGITVVALGVGFSGVAFTASGAHASFPPPEDLNSNPATLPPPPAPLNTPEHNPAIASDPSDNAWRYNNPNYYSPTTGQKYNQLPPTTTLTGESPQVCCGGTGPRRGQ